MTSFPFARLATRFAAMLSLLLGGWITLNFVQMAFHQNDFTGDAEDVPFDPPQSFLVSKGIATLLFASAGLVGFWGTFVTHPASLNFFSVVSLGSMMFSVSSSLYDFVLINQAAEICQDEFNVGNRTIEKMDKCIEELNEQRIIVIYSLLGMVIVGILSSLCASIYLAEIKRRSSGRGAQESRQSQTRPRGASQRRWSIATLPPYSQFPEVPKENAPSYHSREDGEDDWEATHSSHSNQEEEPLLDHASAPSSSSQPLLGGVGRLPPNYESMGALSSSRPSHHHESPPPQQTV